jgi:hypothetical protein
LIEEPVISKGKDVTSRPVSQALLFTAAGSANAEEECWALRGKENNSV